MERAEEEDLVKGLTPTSSVVSLGLGAIARQVTVSLMVHGNT